MSTQDGIQRNIPAEFSTGGLTLEDRGYKQQTFLGASIRNFTMSAGFGDESSTLSVDLVEDEYNKSDGTAKGEGADVYHNGKHDEFVPPFVGSPVFFTFGKDYADINEAFTGVFEYIYESGTTSSGVTLTDGSYSGAISGVKLEDLQENEYYDIERSGTVIVEQDDGNIGRGHITFGGILQSFVETRSPQGNSVYSAKISDPREILNSVNLILNNFTGSINKTDNLFNIYGFLEHNPSADTIEELGGENSKDVVTRNVSAEGEVSYSGTDTFGGSGFPITGTGFSRRSDRGIPFYRVAQSINSLLGTTADLPEEYKDMSFGDKINFRGLKYVVDLAGLPPVPDFYSLDFDSMTLLDLCLEICDITNTDLYVTLLPVLNFGKWTDLYTKNETASPDDLVVGIIRVDSIDRKKQPEIGAIQSYLKDLKEDEIYVKNSDVGFELSNITTDKFIVGGQECNMHFFSANSDKDKINQAGKKADGVQQQNLGDQWNLSNGLEQQIIPYYGNLGNNCISPPRGWGAYQQILLDSSTVAANGVGNYYVATEMELRCALAGYDRWVEFLMQYNDVYLEPLPSDSIEGGGVQGEAINIGGESDSESSSPSIPMEQNPYCVTVPRSVFPHYGDNDETGTKQCNPPMGWPLYYNRAANLGIPQAGLVNIQLLWTAQVLPDLQKLKKLIDNQKVTNENFTVLVNQTWDNIKSKVRILKDSDAANTLKIMVDSLAEAVKQGGIRLIEERIENSFKTSVAISKLSKKGTRNAKAVHDFLKGIAEECLGKKYLVKIPKKVNFCYDKNITYGDIDGIYKKGPFGFKPHPKTSEAITKNDKDFIESYSSECNSLKYPISSFLSSGVDDTHSEYLGAVDVHYNPFSDAYDYNYYPETEGGFFAEDIYKELLSKEGSLSIRKGDKKAGKGFSGLKNQLIPLDLPTFINDNNRISAYVRFDHSEELFLGSMNSSDFSQETISTDGRIPDVVYALDNIDSESNKFHSFGGTENQDQNKEKQVAFVKCSIDSNFYYAPKLKSYTGAVYNDVSGVPEVTQPIEVYSDDEEYQTVMTNARTHFIPALNAGAVSASDGVLDFVTNTTEFENKKIVKIDTSVEEREIEHIYALITLPVKVEPLVDSRFRDGLYQNVAPEKIKHFMTMDVVKDFSPFTLPYAKQPTAVESLKDCDNNLSNEEITKQSLEVVEKLQYAFPQFINYKVPSPVVPDLVALPLRSTERCYGPWSSQWIDSRNEDEQKQNKPIEERFIELGGPVEFIKEEALAPWNYAGYKGLNETGKLQAQFANNLLLLSERGGFSYADAPKNVYLAEELKERGPLVTNINVNISTAGINTTVQLDLYTVSFGKLHKYRQQKIQQASREKLKLRDEKNALIRKNMGKNQKSQDYNILYRKIEEDVKNSQEMSRNLLTKGNGGHSTDLVATSTSLETEGQNLDTQESTTVKRDGVEITAQSSSDISMSSENFNSFSSAAKSYSRSAGGSFKDMYVPISNDPNYYHMPYKQDSFNEQKQSLYPSTSVEGVEEEDLTKYEE